MSVDDFLGAGFMEEGSDEVCCPHVCYAPRIQPFQEDDPEGSDSDEEEEDDERSSRMTVLYLQSMISTVRRTVGTL
jgi:hypothetical protein